MISAIKALFASRKFLLFIATLIVMAANKWLKWFHWDTTEVVAGLMFVGTLIFGIAYEDGKTKSNPNTATVEKKEA